MNRLTLPLTTAALLMLTFAPASAWAYGGDIDCPPHPDHCYMNPIELLDGTMVHATAQVESEVTATTGGAQMYVQLGASAKVVVTLSINSTPSGNRTVDVTVVVNETAGMQLVDPGTRSTTLTTAAPSILEFEFETDEDLSEGDVLFIPVLVRAESLTTSGFAPFVVGSQADVVEPGDDDILLPILTGLLGLGSGSGLTWLALRKT